VADSALFYADQNESEHNPLERAARKGKVKSHL
jgi:hypothetical protein